MLGYMYDGFPIYGYRSLNGVEPSFDTGSLDACNGHTHEIDGAVRYHYHLTKHAPWSIACFKGCPDPSLMNLGGSLKDLYQQACSDPLASDPSPLIVDDGDSTTTSAATTPTSATTTQATSATTTQATTITTDRSPTTTNSNSDDSETPSGSEVSSTVRLCGSLLSLSSLTLFYGLCIYVL